MLVCPVQGHGFNSLQQHKSNSVRHLGLRVLRSQDMQHALAPGSPFLPSLLFTSAIINLQVLCPLPPFHLQQMPTHGSNCPPCSFAHPWQSSLPCLSSTQNFNKKLMSQVCTCVFLRKQMSFSIFLLCPLSVPLAEKQSGHALPSIQAGGALPSCPHGWAVYLPKPVPMLSQPNAVNGG